MKKGTRWRHGRGNKSDRTHRIWSSMRQRCSDINAVNWERYGGRGITVCERWLTFENFLEDMGDPPEANMQLDRIDNSKGYSKENVRWVTPRQNSQNRRSTVFVEFLGEKICFNECLRRFKISERAVYYRMKTHGLTREQALLDVHQNPKRHKGNKPITSTESTQCSD